MGTTRSELESSVPELVPGIIGINIELSGSCILLAAKIPTAWFPQFGNQLEAGLSLWGSNKHRVHHTSARETAQTMSLASGNGTVPVSNADAYLSKYHRSMGLHHVLPSSGSYTLLTQCSLEQ